MTGKAFRLLSATIDVFYAKKQGLRIWRRPDKDAAPNRKINIEFSKPPVGASNANWFTVLIGRNGIGKSRILSNISELFALSAGDLNSIAGRYDRTSAVYSLNGRMTRIESASPDNHFEELPRKVITSTVTPFDKFRLSRRVGQERMRKITELSQGSNETYSYIGLRDTNGRTNSQLMIFRSLEALIEKTSRGDRARAEVRNILHFLGYGSVFRLWYRPRFDSNLPKLLSILHPVIDLATGEKVLQEVLGDRAVEVLLGIPEGTERLKSSLSALRDMTEHQSSLAIEIDLLSGEPIKNLMDSLSFLRRLNIITIDRVEIYRKSKDSYVNLLDASSGEMSIFATFLGIASVIEDNSLIFIDEPEISLHPEWQSKYMSLLSQTFSVYSGCHFIIATHSPLILSDIEKDRSNVVVLGDDESVNESADQFAGESVDALLVEAFDAPGNSNRYLRDKMIEALRLASKGETDSAKFLNSLRVLVRAKDKLPADSPLIPLINEFDDLLDEAAK